MFGLRDWRIIKVAGVSMAPALNDGDFVIAEAGVSVGALSDGDIVVVDHPRFGAIVKAIGPVDGSGRRRLYGVSDRSTPADALGYVEPGGRVARARWRVGRRGIARIAPLREQTGQKSGQQK
ncbi:MAG: S24/S26 family peptidase [Pseudomonadota bacterium]